MVVSNTFYFHPYLGKIPILTHIFQKGLKPPTSLGNQHIPKQRQLGRWVSFLIGGINFCFPGGPCVFFSSASSQHLEFLFPKFWGVRRDLIHLRVVEFSQKLPSPKSHIFVAESESLGRKRDSDGMEILGRSHAALLEPWEYHVNTGLAV